MEVHAAENGLLRMTRAVESRHIGTRESRNALLLRALPLDGLMPVRPF